MDPPNILLVILDSVRGKNIGHLGYPRDTTPEMDEFAEQATTYTAARAPGIHSMPSHVSIFTGYPVAAHRATSHAVSLSSGHTIWEFLQDEGYETGLFTSNAIVAEASNLDTFFQTVEGPKRRRLVFPEALGPERMDGKPTPTEFIRASLRSDAPIRSIINGIDRKFRTLKASHDPEKETGGVYVSDLLDWQDSTEGPWAACLNLMDAHYPYLPEDVHQIWADSSLRDIHEEAIGGPLSEQYLGDRPFWELEAFENLYDCCIRQADAYVGDLIEGLKRRGEFENTLLVVTSDHGEGFGEYSIVSEEVRLIDHSWGIGEELSHVPLLVKYPHQTTAETIEKPASLTKFPELVRSVLEEKQGSMVPEGETVLTSSYRIEEPGTELRIPDSERKPYFGPWHALCYRNGEKIIVDAVRREDAIRYVFSDMNWATPHEKSEIHTKVDNHVEDIHTTNISVENTDISKGVEDRLHELGYFT